MPKQQVPVDQPLAGPEEHGIAHVDQRCEEREVLTAVASEDDVARVCFARQDEMMCGGRADVVFVEFPFRPSELFRDLVRLAQQPDGAALARDPREREVRDERCCRVERREAKSAIQTNNVAARREVREVITLLGEERAEQPQAVMPVLGKDTPGGEVAERLAPIIDPSLRVQREMGTCMPGPPSSRRKPWFGWSTLQGGAIARSQSWTPTREL